MNIGVMFVRVERQYVHGIADLTGIQVFDSVLGAENDIAIVVDGVLGEVDVTVEAEQAGHEFVGGIGVFRKLRERDDGEGDEQRFDVNEERKDAISTAEPAAQRGFGEHFHGPTLRLEDATDVFQDHRALSSEFFAMRQRE